MKVEALVRRGMVKGEKDQIPVAETLSAVYFPKGSKSLAKAIAQLPDICHGCLVFLNENELRRGTRLVSITGPGVASGSFTLIADHIGETPRHIAAHENSGGIVRLCKVVSIDNKKANRNLRVSLIKFLT